jgi:quercetin dioxygenase-like cupin family protein
MLDSFEYKNIDKVAWEEKDHAFIKGLIERNNYKCFFVELKPYKIIPYHSHSSNDQSVIFLNGRGEFTIDGEKMKVSKNVIVFIKRGTEHSLKNLSNKKLRYFEMTL